MIRFKNTRTGREVPAKDGRDLAKMLKIEQDRRTGAELADGREPMTRADVIRRDLRPSPEQGMADGLSPIRRCGKPA